MNPAQLSAAMTDVVVGHMQRHPELTATPDGADALRELVTTGAEELLRETADGDPLAVGSASAAALMDEITARATSGPDVGGGPHAVTADVVREALRRRCPFWPFCAPEPS